MMFKYLIINTLQFSLHSLFYTTLLEKDLRSKFILNAVCYAAWINSPQNTPNDVLVPFVQKAIEQAFNEDKLSSIQEIDISLTPDIIHEDKVVQLKQVDLEYINEKFACTRKLLAAFPTQLDACKRIYLEIYKNFNLNPNDYNPHLLPWLCLSIVEAAASIDKNTLNVLDKNSSPTFQLQNTTHSLTNKDIDFINNIFRFAKKELNLI